MSRLKLSLSWSCYFLGLGCLLISLFFPATAQQMVSDGEVKYWESPARTHFFLALGPLTNTMELISVVLDPGEYGVSSDDLGYASMLDERTKTLFCSIPVSVSWFAVWLTLFLRKRMSPFILRVGGFSMLFTAAILSVDYHALATIYPGYFHLGLGAYFIVGSFLLSGIGLLTLPRYEIHGEAQGLAGDISPPRNPIIVFALGLVIPGAGLCYLGKWIWGIATAVLFLCIVIANFFFGISYYAPGLPSIIILLSAVWAALLTGKKASEK